ncbi:MAG: hypothetical protein ACLR1U_03785 [Clostridia bacterium]|jgi:hypothetical protein
MEKENKKIYKKWWFWLIIIFIIIILGTGNSNISNTTPTNSNTTNNIIESNNTTAAENNNISNVPSEDNYKKYVYEVFDKHYNGSYNISGDKSDWKIITTLTRTKLEGIAIVNNNRYNFYIILEFSDDTFSDYTVKYFQVGDDKIINN